MPIELISPALSREGQAHETKIDKTYFGTTLLTCLVPELETSVLDAQHLIDA